MTAANLDGNEDIHIDGNAPLHANASDDATLSALMVGGESVDACTGFAEWN